jgi:hypothetical protein
MNRNFAQIAVFTGLVVLGVATRLAPQVLHVNTYNITATAAAGLFAGFFFARWQVALLVPMAIMLIGDLFLGGYDWQMMIMNYAAMLLAVGVGRMLQGRLAAGNVLLASLATSTAFFLISNVGVWYCWEPHTWEGLIGCYTKALPFFGRTLLGDLGFATALFGAYALAMQAGRVEKPATAS